MAILLPESSPVSVSAFTRKQSEMDLQACIPIREPSLRAGFHLQVFRLQYAVADDITFLLSCRLIRQTETA